MDRNIWVCGSGVGAKKRNLNKGKDFLEAGGGFGGGSPFRPSSNTLPTPRSSEWALFGLDLAGGGMLSS